MWFRDHELFAGFLRENRWELLILLVLAGLISGGAVYYTQQSKLSPVVREERGALKLEQVVINDYQLDLKRWRIQGERAIVLETSRRMRIEQARIEVFVPHSAAVSDPKVNLDISANEALAEWRDQRITLLGDVKIRHDTGLEIHTEVAVYDVQKEFLTIPKPLTMRQAGHVVTGDSLTYDLRRGKLNLVAPKALVGEP
tara:strand:- start:121 stop:717 length:597 start_codon:yes stop_codon:yes gene_type:complete